MQKLKAPIQIKFSCGGENNVKNQIILLSRDPPSSSLTGDGKGSGLGLPPPEQTDIGEKECMPCLQGWNSLIEKSINTSFYILCNFPFTICKSSFLVDVNDV